MLAYLLAPPVSADTKRFASITLGKIEMLNLTLFRLHRGIFFFYAIAGVLLLGVAIYSVIFDQKQSNSDISSMPWAGLGVVYGIFIYAHWTASVGAADGKRWAKNLSIVLGMFLLFGFPIGTIIGAYILRHAVWKWENVRGFTELMRAAADGKFAGTTDLLGLGYTPNEQDANGGTALHYAVLNRHPDVVSLLLEAGADTSLKSNSGKTALDIARSINWDEGIRLLEQPEQSS